MQYRREIDGLRAFAVVPVILFHAGFSLFSGGFVGVDVFFVISGYLVTSILISDIEGNKYSIVSFYERRARRILPALFLVMACCLPFAWFWLGPKDMQSFARSLLSVIVYGSNIFFWSKTDYFDTSAELKPLLHTWSLSVEEQFYIVLPVLLAISLRFGRKPVVTMLCLICAASLLASEWGAHNARSANFFLLPFRSWELLTGSIAAFAIAGGLDARVKGWLRELLALAGFLMILASVFLFDESMPAPGLLSLLPTLGTALIILFASCHCIVGRILCLRIFVAIGLISYSAYLWHQPVFAFARYASPAELQWYWFIGLVAVSLLLAWASWRYVEQPFRDRKRVSPRGILYFCLAGSLAFIVAGLVLMKTDGRHRSAPDYLTAEIDFQWGAGVRMYQCHLQTPKEDQWDEVCFGQPGAEHLAVLWGDSHAASLYPGLDWLIGQHAGWTLGQLTQSGCGPLFDLPRLRWKPDCNQLNERILLHLQQLKPAVVLLHAAWIHRDYQLSDEEFASKVRTTLARIRQALPDSKVLVLGSVPRWHKSPQRDALVQWWRYPASLDQPGGQLYLQAMQLQVADRVLEDTAGQLGLNYISLTRALCNGGKCLARLGDGPQDWTAIDYGHLSLAGSMHAVSLIRDEIEPLLR